VRNAYLSLPAISLMACSAACSVALLAQEQPPFKSNHIISVETPEAEIDGLNILPIGDEPFTARIEGSVVYEAELLKPPYLGVDQSGWIPPLTGSIDYSWSWAGVQFFEMLARNAAGKIYYESRRATGLRNPNGWISPAAEERPSVFYIIDPQKHTRTVCMTRSKLCKIEALPTYAPAGPPGDAKFPRATEIKVTNLGIKTQAGLEVQGTLETTTLVAHAFGNPNRLVDEKELWHSNEMGLDVFCKRKDSQKETVTTAEIKEIAQKQPDPQYFEIPADFTVVNEVRAQERFPGEPPEPLQILGPNVVIDDMHVSPKPRQPFSAKMLEAHVPEGNAHTKVQFTQVRMVARDSLGRVYYESRRMIYGPANFEPRGQFFVVDRKAGTRTTCYPQTKSCRIDELSVVSYEDPPGDGTYPPSFTIKTTPLGESTKYGLQVLATRETTTFVRGAAHKHEPLVTGKEVLHSPELGLDIAVKGADPRLGMWARELQDIVREEPDANDFGIPTTYQVFDNRPAESN